MAKSKKRKNSDYKTSILTEETSTSKNGKKDGTRWAKAQEKAKGEAEKEKYKELKDELILEVQDTEITAANAAALSNKLCQMSNGAVYDDENNIIPIHNRKLDALEDII